MHIINALETNETLKEIWSVMFASDYVVYSKPASVTTCVKNGGHAETEMLFRPPCPDPFERRNSAIVRKEDGESDCYGDERQSGR